MPKACFWATPSYIFVPDNENYEDSVKLLFDEHNHPVDPKEVDLADKRYQWTASPLGAVHLQTEPMVRPRLFAR